MSVSRATKSVVLAIFFLGAVLLLGFGFQGNAAARSPDYKELRMFKNVMNIVQKNYVKEVSDKELFHGAFTGMLQSLDPESSFLTEDMLKELQAASKEEFAGIGIEFTVENGYFTVVAPIEDSPAYKAGLKPGDKIYKINGETTKNITLMSALNQMRGPKGTKVTVTVAREGIKDKDFTITREVIHVKSVKKQLLEPGYAYIRVVNFQTSTDSDLEAVIKEFGDDTSIKGLILDLRNNPGGLFDPGLKIAKLFVDKGLIVCRENKVKDQRLEFHADKSGTHYNFKMAVLINHGSASTSEIVAGAMQDHDRALLLGTRSFGRASFQTTIPLDNGEGLRLTTALYYTPNGREIQKKGIQPDVDLKEAVQKQVKQEAEQERDPEKKKEQITRFTKDSKEALESDVVVQKALEWLKSDKTVKATKEELVAQNPAPAQDKDKEGATDTTWYDK